MESNTSTQHRPIVGGPYTPEHDHAPRPRRRPAWWATVREIITVAGLVLGGFAGVAMLLGVSVRGPADGIAAETSLRAKADSIHDARIAAIEARERQRDEEWSALLYMSCVMVRRADPSLEIGACRQRTIRGVGQ